MTTITTVGQRWRYFNFSSKITFFIVEVISISPLKYIILDVKYNYMDWFGSEWRPTRIGDIKVHYLSKFDERKDFDCCWEYLTGQDKL
jgi:hypothetical protein